MENKSKKTERILSSLDGIQRQGAPDFFYTRLTGRMQREPESKQAFLLRPVFISTVLSVFLILNIFSLIKITNVPKKTDVVIRNVKPATIESFASAYNMDTKSVYE